MPFPSWKRRAACPAASAPPARAGTASAANAEHVRDGMSGASGAGHPPGLAFIPATEARGSVQENPGRVNAKRRETSARWSPFQRGRGLRDGGLDGHVVPDRDPGPAVPASSRPDGRTRGASEGKNNGFRPDRALPRAESGRSARGSSTPSSGTTCASRTPRELPEGRATAGRGVPSRRTTATRFAWRKSPGCFPQRRPPVPFRNPADHAASTLRRHLRLEKDPSRRGVHAPLPGRCRPPRPRRRLAPHRLRPPAGPRRPGTAGGANFRSRSRRAAFGHVLANPDGNVVLADYDGLCTEPAIHLRRIAARAGPAGTTALARAAGRFLAPTRYDAEALDVDAKPLDEWTRRLRSTGGRRRTAPDGSWRSRRRRRSSLHVNRAAGRPYRGAPRLRPSRAPEDRSLPPTGSMQLRLGPPPVEYAAGAAGARWRTFVLQAVRAPYLDTRNTIGELSPAAISRFRRQQLRTGSGKSSGGMQYRESFSVSVPTRSTYSLEEAALSWKPVPAACPEIEHISRLTPDVSRNRKGRFLSGTSIIH